MSNRVVDDVNAKNRDLTPVAGTLVLALGNPLRGDDGAGLAVLEMLADDETLPDDVALLDGGLMAWEMLLLMQAYRRVIIVDAGNFGQNPGQWNCFTTDMLTVPAREAELPTIHHAGLAEVLALGKVLNMLPSDMVIYAVQPSNLGWSPKLSEPVRQAIPEVCAAISNRIRNCAGHRFQSPV